MAGIIPNSTCGFPTGSRYHEGREVTATADFSSPERVNSEMMRRDGKDRVVKLNRNAIMGCICAAVLVGACGCQKQVSNEEAKKDFTGQSGKKFDPNDLPPQVRAGFDKYMKQGGPKTSGPSNTASGQR